MTLARKETSRAAAEANVFYYALLSWRARPEERPGFRSFSLAQGSGYGMFCVLLTIAVVIEGLPVHLLLHRWSHAAAWIVSGLGAYSLLWLIALYRSLVLKPVLAGAETIVLQDRFPVAGGNPARSNPHH